MTTSASTARACLAATSPAPLEYDEWLAVGMACKDAGLDFEEWDAWSRQDPKRYKPSEMLSKWASFRGSSTRLVGVGTLVKLARDQGHQIDTGVPADGGRELAWDSPIGGSHEAERPALQVIRQEWLQEVPLPEKPGKWDGREDLASYIRTLFNSDERVGYVVETWEQDNPDGSKRYLPRKGAWDRTAGEILEALACAKDLGEVLGDWNSLAGAWIRFNPLDGEGCADTNVTAFRFALVESDDISVERQYAIYLQLELPIAALVHSGGKSLHAIVRIDAPDFREYQKRVDFLYEVCKKNGLVIDRKNRNPSRLSRLPGATREGKRQWLVSTNIGRPSWADWADWFAAQHDNLPDVENLAAYVTDRPVLAAPIIEGILRRGHKMLLAGPSKAGKSFLLLQLAIAIAEGREWLGWRCARGRVLYVNLELDRASAICRLLDLYQYLGIPPAHAQDVDIWNLRGKALPMTDLAPRLIRRASKRPVSAVIIDPIYKVITGDENAAHEMAKFCNEFDRVCSELGCATIYCHHHSKGGQGQKHAADRASGSGVFARDPDAMLDLIELIVDDPRRAQLSNRWECDAMAAMLNRELPDWRQECSQDDAKVADKLALWALTKVSHELVTKARAPAVDAASAATGWRIEGILREFRDFAPRRFWFRWPIHVPDDGLLLDASAEGELPERRAPAEAGKDKTARKNADTRNAIDAVREPSGVVRMTALVEYLGLARRTVQERVADVGLVIRDGLVEKPQNPDDKGDE